ncbi:MAG: carbonic anhydrase [Proteobacteria bacterium]|nr:carbonic anhydrase [Pseudomonadota bacterium]MBU1594228.1 carbonic anhydrase [Pseudomonadota bacterium]
MKTWTIGALALALGLCAPAFAASGSQGIPADEALQLLKDGNARFVSGQSTHSRRDADRRAETVKGGQHPFATIVGCSDSREPLEIIFDQGIGDIFVIRVAGNVAGPDELASVEYGVGHLNTPVLLVLGHTSCGAVTAAVQNAKVHGNLPFLINQIKPAVAKAKAWNPAASGEELLGKSIKANVWQTMENMFRKSVEVREFVEKGKLLVIGAIYDLDSGQVNWLGAHPEQAKLLAATPKAHAPVKTKRAPAPASAPTPAPQDAKDQGPMIDLAPPAQPAAAAPAHP